MMFNIPFWISFFHFYNCFFIRYKNRYLPLKIGGLNAMFFSFVKYLIPKGCERWEKNVDKNLENLWFDRSLGMSDYPCEKPILLGEILTSNPAEDKR